MNKKVSTILTVGLMLGGSLLSSTAFGQSTAIDMSLAKTLDEYSSGAVLLEQGSQFLGFDENGAKTVSNTGTISPAEKNNYLWSVVVLPKSDSRSETQYQFVNVATGDTLAFTKNDGILRITDTSVKGSEVYATDADKAVWTFAFNSGSANIAAYKKSNKLATVADVKIGTPATDQQGAVAISTSSPIVSLVELASASALNMAELVDAKITASELNSWYNGKGFNLAANGQNVLDNLFGGDTRIWAFDVNGTDANADGVEGISVGTTSDGDKLIVPNGTYFFTDPVFNGNVGESDFMPDANPRATASNINWLASTFIAMSSTETKEATNNDRGNGEGFVLRTAKGEDFIFHQNTSEPAGEDLSIWNACFTVEDNHAASNAFPYSISLQKFFYKAGVNDANTKAQTEKAGVYIGVSGYNGTDYRVVSRRTGDAVHAFGFSDSSVEDGRSLLNDTKTAAVYTIKFVEGTNADKKLMDKYLTVGANDYINGWQYEAKGEAITETSFPAFQWLITAAEKANANDSKYVNVTFTNRETGVKFETKLFKESGENRYSLSTTDIQEVVPYTVNTTSANTYVVEKQTPSINFDADLIVELVKLDEVDPYAGFLKVDDKTIRTLAFARDKNDTSNKLYAVVEEDPKGSEQYRLNDMNDFATDIMDADQWQLVRSKSAVSQTRVFVYNNTATESVDDVANGDKIYAYTYALRRVVDGTETDYVLKNAAVSGDLDLKEVISDDLSKKDGLENFQKNLTSTSDPDYTDINFIIKENVDGSVSLLKREDFGGSVTGIYKPFGKVGAKKVVEVVKSGDNYQYDFNDEEAYVSEDDDALEIRTYLDPRPIEISWPAHEGHVTLESELGNYITMNEDRDAIVVNENVADTYYLYVTDEDAIVPSFYITRGVGAVDEERMYMFNPVDSAEYYVTLDGDYSRIYKWNEDQTKVMFKSGIINETRDTLTLTVKGEADKKVAMEADDNDENIWGGLNRFKFQIIEAGDEAEGYYRIRQTNANPEGLNYLSATNEKMTWSGKEQAMLFTIESVAAPTANEGVSATEVKIIATDGAVNVKNAAGKNVVISTILGQIVANEVLTSDNATISVPAGIAIVSVDGEEAVKVSVR
jgi:hypothetical protein